MYRIYVQLPTEAAHEFHDMPVVCMMQQPSDQNPDRSLSSQHQLHPDVVNKIRELVSQGEIRQFVIRNLLRYELFQLSYYYSHLNLAD